MPTRPNDNWSLIDSCRETTRGEFAVNAKICLERSSIVTLAQVKTMYMCIKLSYTWLHKKTAIADNWSAVAMMIAQNRLPSISVSIFSGKHKSI